MSRSRRSRGSGWIPAFAGMTLLVVAGAWAAPYPGIGRAATPAEIRAWDIDVRPDFKGLPAGSGSVQKGQQVWDDKCASCHGTFGESNEVFTPIVGGITAEDIRTGRVKALTAGEQRSTLMKLPTISTLWDYVNRAMPWNAPKSLATDEVYAVVAYILHLGDVLPADFVLSNENIAAVQARLPNRNGMTHEHALWDIEARPDVRNHACMKDCEPQVRIASAMPAHARDSHGNLAEQNRLVGPVRGIVLASAKAKATPEGEARATLAAAGASGHASRQACLACHAVDKRLVGPSFREVAERYHGKKGIESMLAEKVRRGGSGAWGPVPMPAHPALSEADALGLVRWILDGAG